MDFSKSSVKENHVKRTAENNNTCDVDQAEKKKQKVLFVD